MKDAGSTLIISSHILFGLDEIIDDVLVLIEGKVTAYGHKSRLWENLSEKTIETVYSKVLSDAGAGCGNLRTQAAAVR